MKNPLLEPGKAFQFEAMNPNPSSSKTKDGPVYRVSFEIEREVWDWFMEADTKGMILVLSGCVYSDIEQDANPEKKHHVQSYAQKLYQSGFFSVWAISGMDDSTDDDYRSWCRTQKCAACGSRQNIVYAHNRNAANAGTAIKPELSGFPLCNNCHVLEHAKGKSAVYYSSLGNPHEVSAGPDIDKILGRDWYDKQTNKHLNLWGKERFKLYYGIDSIGEIGSLADLASIVKNDSLLMCAPQ